MALKVAIAAGGAAKTVLKPALLCRPWEVSGEWAVGQLQRSLGDFTPNGDQEWSKGSLSNLEFDWLCSP